MTKLASIDRSKLMRHEHTSSTRLEACMNLIHDKQLVEDKFNISGQSYSVNPCQILKSDTTLVDFVWFLIRSAASDSRSKD